MAEAQACGTPVIAFGRGGAAEIVRTGEDEPEPTGELFWQQNENGVVRGVRRFLARRDALRARGVPAQRRALRRRPLPQGARPTHVEQVVAAR